MGAAASLLDESTSNYIKGQVESELKDFGPYYRRQYSVTHFSRVEEELEQHQQKLTQLLKQRDAPEAGEVLYEDAVLHFDESRKWRERYVVVRANYCLECHDSLETFLKGAPARHKLLPTGGAVLTTEEKYMTMVDKCFPLTTKNLKEEFAPPLTSMPGQFPVYLRLPYRRDYYFCFRQEAKQANFLSILSACIRHQNQDFLKKKTCEVQAFLKAIQLYRQEKGKYEAWDMMIGSDVRVMANLVMEQLLPTLEKDMLPRLKAKKTERKRMWFATVEASYILVQEHLLDGMSLLKKECGATGHQQEVLIHSDMDQIVSSRALLEDKLRASVSEPAERFCSEGVQPYLASVLEELMEPVSSGFLEGRALSEDLMDELCKDLQTNGLTDEVKKQLAQMSRPNLLSCYHKIAALNEKLPDLQERFGFYNISSLVHSAQIDLQQLMENAAYTFELLLQKVIQDRPEQAASAMEKAKHRVLKQYDYDSSTVRKKVFQEALVAITLPHIKKNLAAVCKPELQRLEQSIDADHTPFVQVENAYESILLQTLDKEVTKVVKEAAILKKHNLLNDSRDLLSRSSRSSLSCSTPPTPGSPARAQSPSTSAPSPESQLRTPPSASPSPPPPSPFSSPPSPLIPNGLTAPPPPLEISSGAEEEEEQSGVAGAAVGAAVGASGELPEVPAAEEVRSAADAPACVAASLGRPDEQTALAAVAANDAARTPEVTATAAAAAVTTTVASTPAHVAPATDADADVAVVTPQVQTPAAVAAPETAREGEQVQKTATDESTAAPSEPGAPSMATDQPQQQQQQQQQQQAEAEPPHASQETLRAAAESVPGTTEEEEDEIALAPPRELSTKLVAPEIETEAPSSGEEVKTAGGNPSQQSAGAGSDPAPSESVESGGEKEASRTPNQEEEEEEGEEVEDQEEGKANVSSGEPPRADAPEGSRAETPGAQVPSPAADGSAGQEAAQTVAAALEAGAASPGPSGEAPPESPSPSPSPSPPPPGESESAIMDSIKAIRDLVEEVIEVEELVHRYPDGVPQEEEE